MANVNIVIGQKVKLAIVPTLSSLNAPISGIPTWVAADLSKVSITPAEDGRTCVVVGKAAGTSVVTASAVGASALTANHSIVVAAVALADAMTLSVEPHVT